MRTRLTISLAAAIAVLAFSAPAQGAVTIGSNLGSTANSNNCMSSDCTTTNLALNADVAPDGLTSPVTGTVTSWRFKSGSATNTVSLRVLRPGAGVTFTGAGRSASVISATGLNGPFTTSLPIRAGDHIGLDRSNGALVLSTDVGATQVFWTMPVLGEGESRAGTTAVNQEVLVQAVVEPTNTLTLGKPKLNKKNGTATMSVSVPNPGQLSFLGAGVKVSGPSGAVAAGDITVRIKAKGKKAKKLRDKGKVAVKPTFSFTPTNGTASSQSKKLKLKRNL